LVSTEPTAHMDVESEPTAASRLRRLAVIVGGGILLVFVGLYGTAYATTRGGVLRGTTVLGVDVGGLSPDEAQRKLESELPDLMARTVTVQAGRQRFPVEPTLAGLDVNAHETIARADTRPLNPVRLLPVLFGVKHRLEPVLAVDDVRLGDTVEGIAAKVAQKVREGAVTFKNGKAVAVEPLEGRVLDSGAAAAQLRRAFLGGEDTTVVPVTTTAPKVGADEVKRAMQEFAQPAMSGPVSLRVGDKKIALQPALIGEHLAMPPDDNARLQPKLDAKGLAAAVLTRSEGFGTKARDASIELVGGRPTVVPSRSGREVKTSDLGAAVLGALTKTTDRIAAVQLKVSTPDFTTAEARALGVKERLSSFTTYYPVVPYRVNNIGRGARLINGSLVLPGESWSLNDTIGERTAANGFVEGYIINQGKFTKELGGGTSQVATTTFNAIFFAGLRDVEHHPHSLYISRYPAGREATVAWGAKDLRFYNDSGHGVLLQATHSPGRITVALWGTKRYDEVRSVSSARYNLRPPKTIESTEKTCENQQPVSGFDIDVTRVFVDGGAEVRRETFHTSYRPTDKIVCRSP